LVFGVGKYWQYLVKYKQYVQFIFFEPNIVKNMFSKKEVSKILKLKGSIRGTVLKTDAKYVLDNYGQKALKKVEEEIRKTGAEIKYDEIKTVGWYPLGWRVISLLVIKETFDWKDDDIFKMGEAAPKNSFIVRTILKYFVSAKKTFSEISVYWQKHYSIGMLSTRKMNEKEKYLIFSLRDFKVHPILCTYFQGYFRAISSMILGGAETQIEESKCPFKNKSASHEFVITWK